MSLGELRKKSCLSPNVCNLGMHMYLELQKLKTVSAVKIWKIFATNISGFLSRIFQPYLVCYAYDRTQPRFACR